MYRNDAYERSDYQTEKSMELVIDLDDAEALSGMTVLDDETGSIVLASVEWERPDYLVLQFEAHGVIGADIATILTASSGIRSPMTSEITSVPSENVHVIYSLTTSELESYGNVFAVSVLFLDREEVDTLQLTFSNLNLIEFRKAP